MFKDLLKAIGLSIAKRGLWVSAIGMALIVVALLAGCKRGGADSGKLNVVSTTGMIHNLVEIIGGDDVSAVGLMGPGIDPHLYKASEGDVNRLAKADLIFYNGLHLEAKMSDVLVKMAGRTKVVAVTDAIPEDQLLSPEAFGGLEDPHVWFDVRMWQTAAKEIQNALIDRDPAHKAAYKKRGNALLAELKRLHQDVVKEISKLPLDRRVLVTAHDAFGYFGRAYQFDVLGLQGISTESKAGTKDVQRLAQTIVDRKIPAIFVESSVPVRNIQAVQAAVQAKGWNVKIGGELFSDAMGTPGTEEGTYIGMVRHNVHTIVSALLGSGK